ncbi:MAG TPA: hypothetical protein PLA50_02290, partial [Bacteroidia bacterium]|nr:hypothetical protein [Bacteroidia bacterium]
MGSYDEFLEGVPHVRSGLGSSMFERSPLSSRTRLHLARNQDGATSEILASRERLEVLREAARSRAQAPRALDALTRLDPASDPDYQTKVMGVLAQNPDAARDQRIANFLGMQGGIFKRAEHDRDRDEQRDWMRGEDERRYRLGLDRDEERYGIQDKRQTEFDEKRYQIEKKRRDEEDIKRRYEALPKEYRKEWDERGLNDRTPEEKRSNLLFIEETLRHKDAVNKARASG